MKLVSLQKKKLRNLIDHFVMKCRMVKFARITSYNELFSGDPTWATLEVGGTGIDGRSMVTKNDYRFLHTLENMGPSPEPNLNSTYTHQDFLKTSRSMLLRFLLIHLQSSMRTMML